MKSKKKYLLSILLFTILLAFTGYLLLKNNDLTEILGRLMNISSEYIVIGIFLIFAYLFTEAIYIKIILKSLNQKINLWKGFVYSCIEFYFSAITPSSTGGQPAQAYYMSKDNIPFSKSSITLLLNTITFKFVLVVMGIIVAVIYPNIVFCNSTLCTIIFMLGIIVNIAIIILCIFVMYSKRWINSIVDIIAKLGYKLHLIKNKEVFLEKLKSQVKEYQESARYIKEHKWIVWKVCFITVVQRLAMFSISYIVYKAFGITGYSYLEIITIQIVVAIAVDSLPLPGGVGASEALLVLIYNNMYGEEIAVSAMLVTRGLSYYLCLILSSIVVLINHLMVGFKKENNLTKD